MSHNKTDGLHDLDDKNNTDATSVATVTVSTNKGLNLFHKFQQFADNINNKTLQEEIANSAINGNKGAKPKGYKYFK